MLLSNSSPRERLSRLGLAYLTMTVCHLVGVYALQYAVMLLRPAWLTAWWFPWVLSLLPLYVLGLPALWLCLRGIPTHPHNPDCTLQNSPAAKLPLGARGWLTLLVIAFGCMTLGGLAGNFTMGILSAVTGKDYAFALNSMVNETPAWFTFVCVCICAPLGEELLFRKLLIDRTRGYGDTISILLSGLLFGLFHGNLFQFFYAFLVGMVLAYVYTRTGRYLACVAMHAAINFMGSVVTPLLSRRLIPYLEDPETISDPPALLCYAALMLWQYGMLMAGLVLLATRHRHRALSRGSCPLDGGRTNALCNPGLAACAAVMAAIMVVNLL
jgi:membrane protease YdiL (CAAX protease family)